MSEEVKGDVVEAVHLPRPHNITASRPTPQRLNLDMTTVEDDSAPINFRFKRRKTTHTKRTPVNSDSAAPPDVQSLDVAATLNVPEALEDEEESVPNLKEIIRNRKRPRNRLKDAAPKAEAAPQTELVQTEAPRQDQYPSRFVSQTGHVVDSSDKQM